LSISETTKKHKATAPKKLTFAIFVCSTSRHQQIQKGEAVEDVSGDLIVTMLEKAGHQVLYKKIVPDDRTLIQEGVKNVLNATALDAVIFCGGTGIAPSDVTIETVSPFLEKTLPGFGEIFRRLSYDRVGSGAVLSRAIAGVAKGKAFFCIPGSPDAARVSVETLILTEAPHIVRHARE
jgi:molybdenum cofactor biosynthesis protein B